MNKLKIKNINLKDAIIRSSKRTSLNFMGDDLLLFRDFDQIPIPHRAFRMDCTFAVICYQGSAKFAINTEVKTVEANDLILFNANETVESMSVSEDFNGVTIFISKSFIEDIIMNYEDISSLLLFSREHPVIRLSEKDAATFAEYYTMLEKRLHDMGNHFRKEIVRSTLLAWIYDLSNIIYSNQQGLVNNKKRGDAIFASFLKLVEANFRTEKRVTWYSEQLCISPKYLSAVIKNTSGRTPNEWIDYYIILEARVMMKNTTKSVKEVADELGFPNQSFFGKFFKERVGYSPLSFRRKE